RQDWVIGTKVGEEFSAGKSHFDFSGAHTRDSVERSLRRLKTDYLDLVLSTLMETISTYWKTQIVLSL
ncbi:MAG: aldo/keto reductase, partial [Pseudomonadota bacterium]|nr:aldo/keto reductase [Pseudomonadota bacterium]